MSCLIRLVFSGPLCAVLSFLPFQLAKESTIYTTQLSTSRLVQLHFSWNAALKLAMTDRNWESSNRATTKWLGGGSRQRRQVDFWRYEHAGDTTGEILCRDPTAVVSSQFSKLLMLTSSRVSLVYFCTIRWYVLSRQFGGRLAGSLSRHKSCRQNA